jgi:hypothetical protein
MNLKDTIDLNKLIIFNRKIKIDLPEEVKSFVGDLGDARKDSKTLMPLSKDYQRTGIAGEYVITRLLKQEMNTEIYDGKGDGGTDAMWRGHTVQVKATTIPMDGSGRNPYLIFFTGERLRCDIYILVGVKDNDATIYGWIGRDELANSWRLTQPTYVADKYSGDKRRRILHMNQLKCNMHDNGQNKGNPWL